MKVKIEIDTRTFVRFWLVVIGFALAAFIIYRARTALITIGAAMFLAIAISPLVNRFAKLFPSKSRILGTVISYIVVVGFLCAVIFLVVPPIAEQTAKFMDNVPGLVDAATKQYRGLSEFVQRYHLQDEFNTFIASIKTSAAQVASGIGTTIVTSISSVFSGIAVGVFLLVLTFLMLIEGPVWLNRIWSVYGNEERMKHHKEIVRRMYGVVTSYVNGQLSVSAIAGLVSGVAVFVISLTLGVPTSLAIPAAAIVFLTSLIPLFGATIGAIIISLVLLLSNWLAAIIFLAFFIVYQQVEANFVSPKIQSKRIDLSALAILVSITIGVYLFGIIGGIISIPIAGCLRVLIEEYFERAKKKRLEEEKPISKVLKKIQSAK